ncbi:MAG: response regulator [Burkholderiales bacterium]|jgi:CheY-like chemotaxis protein
MARILVIDDETPIRANLSRMLAMEGHEVVTAEDGLAGLDCIRLQRPDLIFCDLVMPVLDGHGVLAQLLARTDTAAIPFIFLSASADRSEREEGLRRGATDYLTKPFNLGEIRDAIARYLVSPEQAPGAPRDGQ